MGGQRLARAVLASVVTMAGLAGLAISATPAAAASSITAGLDEWSITFSSTTLPSGDVAITVTNNGSNNHNLALKSDPSHTTPNIANGQSAILNVNLGPGTYTFICTLSGHEQLGMTANLTITGTTVVPTTVPTTTPPTTVTPTTAPPTTGPPTTAPPTTVGGPTTTVAPGSTTTTAPTSIPQTATWQCISGLGRQAAATNGGSTEILPLDITLSTGQTAQAAAGQLRLRQPRVTVAMPEELLVRAYRANQLLLGPNTFPAFVWMAVQGTNTQEGIQTMALETTYTATIVDGGGTNNDGNESVAEADPVTHKVTYVFTLPTTLWTPLGPGMIAFSAAPQGTMSTIGVQGQGEGNTPYQINPYGSVFIRQMTNQYASNLDCVNGAVTVNTTPPVTPYSNFGRLVSAARYTIVAATNSPFRTFNVTATNASALTYQVITVNVIGRPLSFDALAHTATMASAGPGEVATGALKPLTIKDPRGTNAGWTVTGQVTPTAGPLVASTLAKSPDFVSTSPTGDVHTIPANNLGWRPSASLAPTSPPGSGGEVAAGPGIADTTQPWLDGLGTPHTLCSAPAGHSGGTFLCNAALYLGIPPDALKGTYVGNLTLTLS